MKLRSFTEKLNKIDEKYPDAEIELTSLKSIIIYPKKENAFILNLNNVDKEYEISGFNYKDDYNSIRDVEGRR